MAQSHVVGWKPLTPPQHWWGPTLFPGWRPPCSRSQPWDSHPCARGGPYSLHPFNPVPLAWGPSLVCLRQWDPPAVAGKGVQEGEEGGSPEIQAVCSWGEPASSPMQCSVPCPRTLCIIFCFSMSSSGPTDTPSLPKPLRHCALRGQTRHNGELQDIPLHFNAQHVILPCCFVGWS